MSNILAARFANTVALVTPEMADWANERLAAASAEVHRINAREQAQQGEERAEMLDDFWPGDDHWLQAFRPYKVENGTLMIPVKGMLLHDFGYQLYDWATGYTYVLRAFQRGMEDPQVQRIAMVISSGGGEVAGLFDVVDQIYAMRGTKPILSLVNEHAYSAAYALASLGDVISVSRTGGVGSVGVVTSHMDASKAMEKAGLKITFVYAGDHKVDGNPYAPLNDDVKNRMQARVDGLYDIFASTAARNLGIDEQVIRDTQALCYSADEALALGLVHEIQPSDQALAAFAGMPKKLSGETMSVPEKDTQAANAAAVEAARAEGHAAGATAGAAAERARIEGILGCDESKHRSAQAFHLALKTNLSVEDAKGILAASPELKPAEATAPAGAAFEQAMQNTGNPEVGANGGNGGEQAGGNVDLMAEFRAATGFGAK